MARRVIHFLTPTFVAVVGFGMAVGLADFLLWAPKAEPEFTGAAGLSAVNLGELELERVVLPNPSLSPEDVVTLQLGGLGDQTPDGVGILQCYCFASPANRAVTGPLENFGRMVRQGPYLSLAQPRAVLVGRPRVQDRLARLLVTVIDQDSQVRAFTFVLARQSGSQFNDCWMTEAVFPASPLNAEEAAPAAPSA